MVRTNKKCRVCIERLQDDGTCKYGCDPALSSPAKRTRSTGAKVDKLTGISLTQTEKHRTSIALSRVDKEFANWSNDMIRRKK